MSTKVAIVVLASSVSAAGSTTKLSPSITSTTVDCRTIEDGQLTYKLTNGPTAPTIAASLAFQISHNGTSWSDYQITGGDTVASSVNSGSIRLDRGVMYLRAIVWGNTIQPVTVEANIQAVQVA